MLIQNIQEPLWKSVWEKNKPITHYKFSKWLESYYNQIISLLLDSNTTFYAQHRFEQLLVENQDLIFSEERDMPYFTSVGGKDSEGKWSCPSISWKRGNKFNILKENKEIINISNSSIWIKASLANQIASSSKTFVTSKDIPVIFALIAQLEHIPWHLYIDNCDLRAHLTCQILEMMGINPDLISKQYCVGKLFFGEYEWKFHVAATLKDDQGNIWIIDPSLHPSGALTCLDWVEKMNAQERIIVDGGELEEGEEIKIDRDILTLYVGRPTTAFMVKDEVMKCKSISKFVQDFDINQSLGVLQYARVTKIISEKFFNYCKNYIFPIDPREGVGMDAHSNDFAHLITLNKLSNLDGVIPTHIDINQIKVEFLFKKERKKIEKALIGREKSQKENILRKWKNKVKNIREEYMEKFNKCLQHAFIRLNIRNFEDLQYAILRKVAEIESYAINEQKRYN